MLNHGICIAITCLNNKKCIILNNLQDYAIFLKLKLSTKIDICIINRLSEEALNYF